jgi:hypothetical protein
MSRFIPFNCDMFSLIFNVSRPMSATPRDTERDMATTDLSDDTEDLAWLDRMLASLDAEREARRAAGIPDPVIEEATPPMPVDLDQVYQTADKLRRMLACFDEGRFRWISFALEGIGAKEPETFHYDEEPFDYVGRHALFDGRNVVNVPRQKRPPHRPRDPRVGDRKVQVVEKFRQLIAINPKVAAAHQQLADELGISVSYVKQILRRARKVGAL